MSAKGSLTSCIKSTNDGESRQCSACHGDCGEDRQRYATPPVQQKQVPDTRMIRMPLWMSAMYRCSRWLAEPKVLLNKDESLLYDVSPTAVTTSASNAESKLGKHLFAAEHSAIHVLQCVGRARRCYLGSRYMTAIQQCS